MRNFTGPYGQRVRVVDAEHALNGKTGTPRRLRMGDNGAWVEMDEDLPVDLILFPKGDNRHRHVLLYPDQCEPTR